jgi:hypothetical protein
MTRRPPLASGAGATELVLRTFTKSQGQHLAVNVLDVPCSLDGGLIGSRGSGQAVIYWMHKANVVVLSDWSETVICRYCNFPSEIQWRSNFRYYF